MFPFLSTKTNRKDKVAARLGICLFALLFFLCALLCSLPSLDGIGETLARYGLAGYAETSDERSDRLNGALEQFTDRPTSDGTSSADTSKAPESTAIPSIPKESIGIACSAV